MKKSKIRLTSLLLVVAMAIGFCTTALAGTSTYDQANLSSSQMAILNDAKSAYAAAEAAAAAATSAAAAAAATAQMAAAHAAAEAVRAAAAGGAYSGGTYGGDYIPITTPAPVTYYPTYPVYIPPTVYSINATAGTGGSISPNGTVSITSGGSQAYIITANSGYKISDVKVDGASVGVSSTYAFSNITAAHSISVTFASAASLSTGSVTLGDGGTGTLATGNKTKSGYGVTVSLPVTSSYVSGTTVTASYNFTSAKTVSLEYVSGTWQFPVNAASAKGARKIYIPVETKDGTYTISFTVKALDPQATALTGSNVYLTSTKSVTLTIEGSMYSDDFTGDS